MNIWEILGGGAGALIVLMSMVEVSKIKINPWSWIAKKIGKALNGEVLDKLDVQGKEIDKLREICDEREANDCRYRILRFDDEIRHSARHTKEHFDQILGDIKSYEDYCSDHPKYRNNVAHFAIQNIKNTYQRCESENSFL